MFNIIENNFAALGYGIPPRGPELRGQDAADTGSKFLVGHEFRDRDTNLRKREKKRLCVTIFIGLKNPFMRSSFPYSPISVESRVFLNISDSFHVC